MRTKNLNLKKKIAFIASVAMIATTAAYLPAGVFTTSAAMNAPTGTALTENEIAGYTTETDKTVDTFAALVKINGKYLGQKTTGTGVSAVTEYKLFSSRAAVKSEGYNEIDASGLDTWTDAYPDVAASGTQGDPGYVPAIDGDFYDELTYDKAGSTNVLAIPYIETANPEVTLEIVARKKAQLDPASATEITVTLDKYGKGVVADNTEPVIAYSDTSDWKIKATPDGSTVGSYEKVDYSGLRVVMLAKGTLESVDSGDKRVINTADSPVAYTKSTSSSTGDAVVAPVANYDAQASNNAFNLKAKEIKPDTYATVTEGNVNANVFTEKIKEKLAPGTPLKIETKFLPGWTITGAGYDSTKGTITLQMGNDGYAVSSLVTATKGDKKEYFKYVVKNGETGLTTTASTGEQAYITFKGIAGTTGFALNDTSTWGTRVKVENELKAMTVPGAGKQYVDVYTVYNNETDNEYNTGDEITIATADKNIEDTEDTLKKTTVPGNATNGVIKYEKTSAGNAETGILKYIISPYVPASGTPGDPGYTAAVPEVAKYFKIIFTNEYEVEYDTWNASKKEFETEAVNTKTVKVTGRTVEKPEDPDLSVVGSKYVSWNTAQTNASSGKEEASAKLVFAASNGTTQIEQGATDITPNMKLKVKSDELLFNVKLDANGGKIVTGSNPGAKTSYAMYNGANSPVESTFSNTKISEENNWTAKSTTNGDIAFKCGFTFLGWSTDKNATKAMTKKEIREAFPGEGKTLTLYAVYKAQSESLITFKNLGFDATTGASAATDYKKYDDAGVATAYGTEDAEFTSAVDKVKMFTPGQKLGELPTPVKSGYEFEGWYIRKIDPAKKSVSGVKVTADTIADESIFNSQITPASASDDSNIGKVDEKTNVSITLYAKFVQKSYKINFEIGDGSWNVVDYEKDTMPVAYKFKGDKIAVVLANGQEVESTDPEALIQDPTIGSDDFTKFEGWKINGGTSKVTSANFWKAIKNLDSAADITAVASYKDQDAQDANINVDSNGGAFYVIDEYNNTDKKATSYLLNAALDGAVTKAKINLNDNPEAVLANKYKVNSDGNIVLVNAENVDLTKSNNDDTQEHSDGAGANSRAGEAYNIYGWTVARPGYTFTGWYSDKECTKPYTFSKIPKKGVEDVVYAGWKANNTVRYVLHYTAFDGDRSLKEEAYKTYMGVIGETANAADLVVNIQDGAGVNAVTKKYVFDKALSSDLENVTAEIKSSFAVGQPAHTVGGTTYAATGLFAGKFEQAMPYTEIEGIYVEEGYQSSAELGKATNVKGTANGKKVTISFTAADNAVKYQVCKIVNGKKYYTAKTDATSIDISPASVDYQVYVIAFDKDGKSTHSETINLAGVPKSTLGTVKNPKVTESLEGDKKIGTVTWDAVEGATWYKVFKVVNGKTYWGSKVTENKYVFKNLPKDSSYIIYVAAGDDNGNVTYGARTKISKYPAVQNVKISADKKTVTFDKAEGAVNYQVAKLINGKTYYGTKSESNSITLQSAAKSGTQIFVLAFFTGEDGKTYSSYSQSITVE